MHPSSVFLDVPSRPTGRRGSSSDSFSVPTPTPIVTTDYNPIPRMTVQTTQERDGYEHRQATIDPRHNHERIPHDANLQQVTSRFGRMKKEEGFIPGTVKLRPPMKKGLFGRPKKEKGIERMTVATLNENPLDMFPENPMQVNSRSASIPQLPPATTTMIPASTRPVQRHTSMTIPSSQIRPLQTTSSLNPSRPFQRPAAFDQHRRRDSSPTITPSPLPLKNDTIDAVLEIFPDANRQRVVQLEQDGKSTRTILCLLADESNDDNNHNNNNSDPQISLSSSSHVVVKDPTIHESEIFSTQRLMSRSTTESDHNEAVMTTERPKLDISQESSFRRSTIREFFPFSKSSRTNELLRENSLATVMDILAEESMENASGNIHS